MYRALWFASLTALVATGALLVGSAAEPPSEPPPSPPPEGSVKKIVFIAGPKDHGGPGAHEYEKDLRLLKECLETSPNVKGVTIQMHVGRAPRDIEQLRDAAAIVIHSSGDRLEKETHAIFQQKGTGTPDGYSEAEEKYLEELDRLLGRGMGIVVLHYSLIVEHPRACSYLLDWIGGYHRSGQSRVKIDRSEAEPAAPGHPILRGVKPWTTDHEYYFDQFLREGEGGPTPILTSLLPSDDPKRHVIAWALERKGGGRGFAFTGGHFHKNLLLEDYRRMLLNAILWTARAEVPEGGVASSVPPERDAAAK